MRQLALRAAVNRHWREKRQCLSPAFFFVLEKAVKGVGNAVIPTFPMHRSYGFQHLRHKRPRLLSPVKVGTHSAFGEKSHTRAHTAKQGPSFPRPQRGFALPVKSILFRHAFIYTFPGSLWTTTISNSSISDHLSSRFSASRTNGPRSLSRVKAGTHSAFGKKSHTRAHTAKQVVFLVGVVSLPSERSARFGNPAWPGGRAANFVVLGSWPGALPKNAESLRDSDALMRVAVPRRRGPAGLRDPVAIVSMIKNMINPWAGSFLIFCWANANSIKKVVLQPF